MSGVERLYRALRELHPKKFEQLCFQVLSERFPTATVRVIDGTAGDDGVDLFAGSLQSGPIVWQCKFFPDGIRDSQKKQIKISLETALQKIKPTLWTLCLPVDLTISNQRWVERLQKDYAGRVAIETFVGSDIVKELVFRQPIREAFFPDYGISPADLRNLLQRTHDLSDSELEQASAENVEQLIERFRRQDARFDYRLTFLANSSDTDHPAAGSVLASIRKGSKRIDVLPRDFKALALDPPHVKFNLVSRAKDKFVKLLKTGMPQMFEAEEIISVTSSFDFLLEKDKPRNARLRLALSVPNKTFKNAVEFVGATQRVKYPLIELKMTRRGTDEAELESVSEKVPLKIRFTVPRDPTSEGKIEVLPKFTGCKLSDAPAALDALQIADSNGLVKFTDLEHDSVMELRLTTQHRLPPMHPVREFVEETLRIASAFQWTLECPAHVTAADKEALVLLAEAVDGAGVCQMPVDKLSATLLRAEGDPNVYWDHLMAQPKLMLEHETLFDELFGQPVSTGPCRMFFDKVKVLNPAELRDAFFNAPLSTGLPIQFATTEPATLVFQRLNPERFATL